jgi:hypothetical protein
MHICTAVCACISHMHLDSVGGAGLRVSRPVRQPVLRCLSAPGTEEVWQAAGQGGSAGTIMLVQQAQSWGRRQVRGATAGSAGAHP